MTTVPTTPAADEGRETIPTAGARPPRPGAASASLVFAWRAFLKLRHTPEQLADAVVIPLLFTVLFTYLFGGALSGSTARYLEFLLPGTLVMSVLLITVYSGLGLNLDVSRGVLDRFRTTPTWRPAYIVGGLVGDAARYLLAATLVVLLGVAMGFRPDGGLVGVVLAVACVVGFAFSLSWLWTTLGLLLRTPASVTTLSFVVQFPLIFASNVFVDPETLPGWLHTFVDINPVSHLVTAERGLMHGTATAGQVGWVVVASAVLVAVFAPTTMYLYGRRQ